MYTQEVKDTLLNRLPDRFNIRPITENRFEVVDEDDMYDDETGTPKSVAQVTLSSREIRVRKRPEGTTTVAKFGSAEQAAGYAHGVIAVQ